MSWKDSVRDSAQLFSRAVKPLTFPSKYYLHKNARAIVSISCSNKMGEKDDLVAGYDGQLLQLCLQLRAGLIVRPQTLRIRATKISCAGKFEGMLQGPDAYIFARALITCLVDFVAAAARAIVGQEFAIQQGSVPSANTRKPRIGSRVEKS